MRSAGGVLLAVGAVVLLARKSEHHQWSTLARLVLVLVPAVVLYTLALVPRARRRQADPEQTVLAVSAILLSPLVLLEFLRWVGARTSSLLYLAAVFALTALLGAYAARRARVTYVVLLAALAAVVAWLLVWAKILDHPSADTYRWLLIAAGAILFCVAGALSLGTAFGAPEVATAGGLATVSAGVFGVVVSSVFGAVVGVTSGTSGEGPHSFPLVSRAHLSGAQQLGWDVYLLVASVALVWVGARVRVRGLGYVGGLGVLAFLISVAAQLARVQSGHSRTSDIVGWPLVLLLVGAAGILGGSLGRTLQSRRS
jgi:hypothetical protein